MNKYSLKNWLYIYKSSIDKLYFEIIEELDSKLYFNYPFFFNKNKFYNDFVKFLYNNSNNSEKIYAII